MKQNELALLNISMCMCEIKQKKKKKTKQTKINVFLKLYDLFFLCKKKKK